MGSGIQAIVKANELSSIMTLCRHGFHIGVIAYMLQVSESTIHRIFVVWVVFIEAMFQCIM